MPRIQAGQHTSSNAGKYADDERENLWKRGCVTDEGVTEHKRSGQSHREGEPAHPRAHRLARRVLFEGLHLSRRSQCFAKVEAKSIPYGAPRPANGMTE
eukprot:scaffold1021_cov241-Pinguiococcus_pyrenoidosus.AAC.9